MNYKISVIVPIYNASRFLEETLKSVESQTYPHWEALLVIDSKSDEISERIAQSFCLRDPRFILISRRSAGTANNRNEGLRVASGDFIAFLDADDIWVREKLEVQLSHMLETGSEISCHAFQRISEDGKEHGRILSVPDKITYKDLLFNNVMGCFTVMVSKKISRDILFEDKGWEDLGYWLKCLKKTSCATGINTVLGFYRIVEQSRSNNKIFSAKMKWKMLREQEKFNPFSAFALMIPYAITGIMKHKIDLRFRSRID